MANEMPSAERYQGLSRKVLEYSEHFNRIIQKIKKGEPTDAAWQRMEELIDVPSWRREGVFTGPQSITSTWPEYRSIITQYGGATSWEGTLRRITEVPGLVYLELEERNTRDGVTDVSNTVTIYEFNAAGKLHKLQVYVSHIGTK